MMPIIIPQTSGPAPPNFYAAFWIVANIAVAIAMAIRAYFWWDEIGPPGTHWFIKIFWFPQDHKYHFTEELNIPAFIFYSVNGIALFIVLIGIVMYFLNKKK